MKKINYRDAIKEALLEEMRADPNLILLGEDIAQGYEGCFGVTKGICEEFGLERIIDTPISEASIIGAAVGASMLGFKTVAEIMFEDFIAVCFDGIINQAAKLKVLSGDQYSLSMVVRTPGGSGGFGAQHSQCLESIFMHIPGLLIAIPSNAYDAKGLLKTAINLRDPVLFFEHQKLYKSFSEIPEEEYQIPFGKGKIVKSGKDLTILSFSHMLDTTLKVSNTLKEKHGLDIEIIDPRTLVPLDIELLVNSVKKTSKLVIIEEGVLRGGVGAEISAQIVESCFDYLDFPIKRIASKNFLIPISPIMEKQVVPSESRVLEEIENFLGI